MTLTTAVGTHSLPLVVRFPAATTKIEGVVHDGHLSKGIDEELYSSESPLHP
jgi:hypothetical protein